MPLPVRSPPVDGLMSALLLDGLWMHARIPNATFIPVTGDNHKLDALMDLDQSFNLRALISELTTLKSLCTVLCSARRVCTVLLIN